MDKNEQQQQQFQEQWWHEQHFRNCGLEHEAARHTLHESELMALKGMLY
jgi:hypothetical protein